MLQTLPTTLCFSENTPFSSNTGFTHTHLTHLHTTLSQDCLTSLTFTNTLGHCLTCRLFLTKPEVNSWELWDHNFLQFGCQSEKRKGEREGRGGEGREEGKKRLGWMGGKEGKGEDGRRKGTEGELNSRILLSEPWHLRFTHGMTNNDINVHHTSLYQQLPDRLTEQMLNHRGKNHAPVCTWSHKSWSEVRGKNHTPVCTWSHKTWLEVRGKNHPRTCLYLIS